MKKVLITSILFLFVFYACGPSSKNETAKWTQNLTELKSIQTKYPGFSSLIEEKIKEATAIYNSAEQIKEEEQKAQKMRDANNVFETGCIGKLKNISAKFDAIQKKQDDLRKARTGQAESDISYSEVVLKDVDKAVKQLKNTMKAVPSSTICDDFEYAYQNLVYAEEDIDRAIQNINDKIQEKKDSSTKVDAANNKKIEDAKDIKCEYCGTFNAPANTKCSSCGAPIKKE
jgi:TolA-binding protein